MTLLVITNKSWFLCYFLLYKLILTYRQISNCIGHRELLYSRLLWIRSHNSCTNTNIKLSNTLIATFSSSIYLRFQLFPGLVKEIEPDDEERRLLDIKIPFASPHPVGRQDARNGNGHLSSCFFIRLNDQK